MPENDTSPTNAQYEVFVPDAVRRAARRADELQASLVADRAAAATGDGAPPPPPPPPAPAPAPAPPPAAAAPPPPPPPPPADWEQRYRTLQGKYDSEVPSLRAHVASMEQLIRTMQTPPASVAPPPAAPPPPAPAIPQEDIDAYGTDLIEANQRWVDARLGPQIAELRRDLDGLRGGQQQLTISTMRERVHQGLDDDPELSSVWHRLNADPGFMAWLNQPDPFSGVVRYELLQQAYNGGDAMRAGRFFKQYIAEHTAPQLSPPPGGTQTPTGQPYTNGHAPPPAGGQRLEDLVTPGRAAGSGSNGSGAPEKRTWSNGQIRQFYDDKSRGKWRHREDEAAQLEADILAASAEGRIRP